MFLCYIDESGTSAMPGNTSHFVLAGLAIPIEKWRNYEGKINAIKRRYGLNSEEIHTGWILRRYGEQDKISGFESMDHARRRSEVTSLRHAKLLELQKNPRNGNAYKQTKKNYVFTDPYIHLTFAERIRFVEELADCVASWGMARLFAECVDKLYSSPVRERQTIDEQAFEQVISRFEQCLKRKDKITKTTNYGLIIHDNNPTVALKHTELMKKFHKQGTLFTDITHIIETPLFVDSQLTGMIQIADVCALAIRQYLEKGDANLFNRIFCRVDKIGKKVVGIRHYTNSSCDCLICQSHRS
jgi:hypothetical protein